jgi:hypothetical protein
MLVSRHPKKIHRYRDIGSYSSLFRAVLQGVFARAPEGLLPALSAPVIAFDIPLQLCYQPHAWTFLMWVSGPDPTHNMEIPP